MNVQQARPAHKQRPTVRKEEIVEHDFLCIQCSCLWTAETIEGEWPACPREDCRSESVVRA